MDLVLPGLKVLHTWTGLPILLVFVVWRTFYSFVLNHLSSGVWEYCRIDARSQVAEIFETRLKFPPWSIWNLVRSHYEGLILQKVYSGGFNSMVNFSRLKILSEPIFNTLLKNASGFTVGREVEIINLRTVIFLRIQMKQSKYNRSTWNGSKI